MDKITRRECPDVFDSRRRIGLADLGAFTRDHEPTNVPGPFTVDRALRSSFACPPAALGKCLSLNRSLA